MSHYEVLGVPRDADQTTIKKAYRSKASKMHPDKGGYHDVWVKIQLAYDTLSDPDKRKHYDVYGTDPRIHAVREQARAELASLFLQVVQAALANGQFQSTLNIVDEMRMHLTNTKAKYKTQRKQIQVAGRNLRRVHKRLSVKDTSDSLLTEVLRQQRVNIVHQYRGVKETIKKTELMLLMVDNYSYDADAPTIRAYTYGGTATSTIF